MNKKSALSLLLAIAFVLYPLLVYFGLQHFDVRIIGLFLLCLLILRLLVGGQLSKNQQLFWVYAAAFIAISGALIAGSSLSLKLYPVLVNASLLLVFVLSLMHPPSIIEKLARLQDPNLPPEAVIYTRKVTTIWCVFFAINGGIALLTVFINDKIWALYNGFISYLCIAALFAGEWLYRKLILNKHGMH